MLLLSCLALAGLPSRAAQTYKFDPANSFIQIHLGTSGLLKAAGHEHLIRTPVQQGTFAYDSQAPRQSSVQVVVNSRELKVIDQKVSAGDRQKIQATMESNRVLDVQQFPTITFKSTSVEPLGENQLRVKGNLTIKGRTNLVTVQVTLIPQASGMKAFGKTQFKQTQFGIKPVTAGLGTVRVQDLMTLGFVIQLTEAH